MATVGVTKIGGQAFDEKGLVKETHDVREKTYGGESKTSSVTGSAFDYIHQKEMYRQRRAAWSNLAATANGAVATENGATDSDRQPPPASSGRPVKVFVRLFEQSSREMPSNGGDTKRVLVESPERTDAAAVKESAGSRHTLSNSTSNSSAGDIQIAGNASYREQDVIENTFEICLDNLTTTSSSKLPSTVGKDYNQKNPSTKSVTDLPPEEKMQQPEKRFSIADNSDLSERPVEKPIDINFHSVTHQESSTNSKPAEPSQPSPEEKESSPPARATDRPPSLEHFLYKSFNTTTSNSRTARTDDQPKAHTRSASPNAEPSSSSNSSSISSKSSGNSKQEFQGAKVLSSTSPASATNARTRQNSRIVQQETSSYPQNWAGSRIDTLKPRSASTGIKQREGIRNLQQERSASNSVGARKVSTIDRLKQELKGVSESFTRQVSTGSLKQEGSTSGKLKTEPKGHVSESATRDGSTGSLKQEGSTIGRLKKEPKGHVSESFTRQGSTGSLMEEGTSGSTFGSIGSSRQEGSIIGRLKKEPKGHVSESFTRQGSTGSLKQESTSGPIFTRHGSTGSSRQEGSIIGRLKKEPKGHVSESFTRQGSTGSLKQESTSGPIFTRHGSTGSSRHEGSTVGRLKKESKGHVSESFTRQGSTDSLMEEGTSGPTFTRHGSIGSSRQEGSIIGRLKKEPKGHVSEPFTRQGSIDSLKQEGTSGRIFPRHGNTGNSRQGGSIIGRLKKEPKGHVSESFTRQGSTDSLKQESTSGPIFTRHGSTGSSRQEGSIIGRLKKEPKGHVSESFTRQGSTGSLKSELTSGHTFTRQGITGSLKQEVASNSANKRQSSTGNLRKEEVSATTGQGSTRSSRQGGASNILTPTGRKQHAASDTMKVPITKVAAATYNGGWLHLGRMVTYLDDIVGLNIFLNDCRIEVEAAVPEKCLNVVMGNEHSDLDSIVSTITYAYFLSRIGNERRQCFVPVINMKHKDFVLRTEVVWLFEVTGVDISNLIFVDQISLSYFHRFGCLKLVLVDHSRLAPYQENLQEAVVEIVDHKKPGSLYEWVTILEIEQVGSCCTIVAERFVAEAPKLLAGQGVNRLLLGAILLDTGNLNARVAHCTSRDQCMAAFLIRGAGCFGQQGLFRLLRRMKFEISVLSNRDMLRRDFREWKFGSGKIDEYSCKGELRSAGMTTLGVPLTEVLIRRDFLDDLKSFQRELNLDLQLIVTGYWDNTNHYKREVLVAPTHIWLSKHLATCFGAQNEELKLSPERVEGLPKEMLVYRQGRVTASRKVLCQLVVDFFAE